MEPPPIQHTIVIFAILVLVTVVLGAVWFPLCAVFRARSAKRKPSISSNCSFVQSEESLKKASGSVHQQQKPETNEFKYWKPLRRRLSTISVVNPFRDPAVYLSPLPKTVSTASTLEPSSGSTFGQGTPKLDVIALSTSGMRKIVYEEAEFFSFKKAVEDASCISAQKHENEGSRTKVKLSQLLRVSFPIPRCYFADLASLAIELEEIVEGTRAKEPFERTMSLFRFVTIGFTEETYDNPYYFTKPFHQAILVLCDPVMLKELPESLQTCVADVVICWSWNQWCCANKVGAQNGDLNRVLTQAANIDESHYHHTCGYDEVWSVLCQMHNGLESFAANTQRPILFKLITVMKACSSTAPCHSHRELVPIFAQAVAIARGPTTLVSLYECLNVMVSPHKQCCLEYRDLAPPTSDLLALLRHGLWTRQTSEVREKAQALADKLGEQFTQMEEWCDQGDTTTETEVMAPGAWSMFR